MKIAYFDCHFGAAGDMLNAALLAAGLDEARWQEQLANIDLPAGVFQAKVSRVIRCGLQATKIDVVDDHGVKIDQLYSAHIDDIEHSCSVEHEQNPVQHNHEHELHHDETELQSHHELNPTHHHHHHHHHRSSTDTQELHAAQAHTHSVGADEEQVHHGPARHLPDILRLIDASNISSTAKNLSSRIFKRLAAAESKVHGVAPHEVHFHEVGAVDAIVDIIGFSIAYDLLAIERSYCSPVGIGSGAVRTEHGLYPVPGPATAYLLSEAGAAVAPGDLRFECLTPTGAAILCEIASSWGVQPAMGKVLSIGYGAGTKDPAGHPNVCRVVLGEAAVSMSAGFATEPVVALETNLDDINPQVLSYAIDRLFQAGALDVTVAPALMKKGRLGQILTVLSRPEDSSKLQSIVFAETTTLGLRVFEMERVIARRQWCCVVLPCGCEVRVKLAVNADGQIVNAHPEYEDCLKCAVLHEIPLKDVISQAMHHFQLNVPASFRESP